MEYHFSNLVFEGGGVKGIAYVGVMEELEARNISAKIKRVGGTSAGAINAVLFACGYTATEIKAVLSTTDFNDFKDNSFFVTKDIKRLVKRYGWNKGKVFEQWMGKLIQAKTGRVGTTFKELKATGGPDLYLIATNLSTHFSEKFSAEHTPNMEIRKAARMSMSIPLFFEAVKHERVKNNPTGKKSVYVDGGVLMNYPVKLFDRKKYLAPSNRIKHALLRSYYDEGPNVRIRRATHKHIYNKETLGLRLDSQAEIDTILSDRLPAITEDIKNILQYSCALVKTILSAQMNQHVHSDDWQRTIYVDTLGIKTTEFSLSDTQKRKLIQSGRDGVRKYFEWYDGVAEDEQKRSANHPEYEER